MPFHPDLTLTSPSNPQIKRLMHLRSRTRRKREDVFLIEGLREIGAALRAGVKLEGLYFSEDLFRQEEVSHAVLASARQQGTPLTSLTRPLFEKVSTREGPDGFLAVGMPWSMGLEKINLKQSSLVLIAEGIEKPGNLGALIRSAESAGVDALILCNPVVDPLSPAVVRNSQGALFTVPLAVASQDAVAWFLKENAIRTVATTPAATTLYWDVDLTGPIAILMGSEKDGLTSYWLNTADVQVKIPLLGAADSLNIATAAVLTLYEALRQRAAK